ncbi:MULTISPECIES: type II toxin-antitoxin system VapC family toxin [Methylotuvimicrobium]|uniref:type II toxin-antitoxin system VapC family toxin n=1 Tax=Methylotuvimicrobium TaxID=2822410 RepID=UPI001E3B844F|nr:MULTISPECIES: type II toxin-antitoxin system VapC family toxin [Methylotuvimicrobium]
MLDSNILSEPARLKPDDNVLQQLADHDGEYATAAIVWHELVYGCELLAASKRKKQLQSYLAMLSANGLMVLPYDQAAADWYAKERARLQRQGLTCAYADGEIAAIAVSQNLTLVTRNTKDFDNFQNLALENWFE